jgi:hypothetical protein
VQLKKMTKGQHVPTNYLRPLMLPTKPQRWQTPRPLIILLSILAILTLAHVIAIHQIGSPAAISATRSKSCALLIHNTDYTKIVPVRTKTQQIAAIQFVNELTGGQPAALIQVNTTGSSKKLDVYLYGCKQKQNPSRPVLTQLFKQQGLINGIADITQIHTLSVEQTDTTLPADKDTLLLPLQQDVFQEYSWKNGSLSQISFPGLYPVTSRSEAEALQDDANNGQSLPWISPLQTAEQMAEDLFQWPVKIIHGTLRDNNGTEAHVLLAKKGTNIQVIVSLTRLIQPRGKGLWWVTSAQTPGISLDQTSFYQQLSSPITISGTINPTQEKVTATLFNHTLTPIKLSNSSTLQTDENGQFSGNLSYANVFPDQPALLLVTEYPKNPQDEAYLFLTNILLK